MISSRATTKKIKTTATTKTTKIVKKVGKGI